jgi:hypothetical protein
MLALSVAKSQNKEASECRSIAEQLIARDEEERNEFGQHVSDTYYRADAFIDATERTRTDDAIRRFVEVVFGHPFATPTADELAMQQAFTAGLRSADLSRQVGAAIVRTTVNCSRLERMTSRKLAAAFTGRESTIIATSGTPTVTSRTRR